MVSSSSAQFSLLLCWNSASKLPRPSRFPGFHVQVAKEGFAFPRFPRIPRKLTFTSWSSAQFSSHYLQSTKWVHTPIIYTFKCFINALIRFFGGNTSKHTVIIVCYIKVSLYTFYQVNHMWFITTIWKVSYGKYMTITSCLLKWNMLLYIYKSNTMFIL